nr:hypothetical protein [Tanacetum cinerariifolium]
EDGEVSVTSEVARAPDAVHHSCTAHMRGVDVAVQVELKRCVDADDAKATHDFRMVGDFLRA